MTTETTTSATAAVTSLRRADASHSAATAADAQPETSPSLLDGYSKL